MRVVIHAEVSQREETPARATDERRGRKEDEQIGQTRADGHRPRQTALAVAPPPPPQRWVERFFQVNGKSCKIPLSDQ